MGPECHEEPKQLELCKLRAPRLSPSSLCLCLPPTLPVCAFCSPVIYGCHGTYLPCGILTTLASASQQVLPMLIFLGDALDCLG
jgi:hypothetical protein